MSGVHGVHDVHDAPSITVCRGSPPTNSYVWSPFVIKLEARLRFDGIPYRLGGGSPPSAPKGKIPYVKMHSAGATETMGDSTLIIRALVDNGILGDANASLTPAQRAHDLAVRAMMEDRAYFYSTREKWCDNYTVMRSNALAAVPWPLQLLVGWLAYRSVTSALYGQGTGRLSGDEVLVFKEEVWESLDALLAESKPSKPSTGRAEPFWLLGGPEPTEADATVYGFIAGALVCDAWVLRTVLVHNRPSRRNLTALCRTPITAKIVRGHPTLVEYARRIHDWYFPDYERWS